LLQQKIQADSTKTSIVSSFLPLMSRNYCKSQSTTWHRNCC